MGKKFTAWYTTPNGDIGTEATIKLLYMPAGNTIVYAKWAPPTYSVKYYLTPDHTGPSGTIEKVPAGDTISESQLTKEMLEGVDFNAWYWYIDDTFVPYDFDTAVINNDYVLYPVWGDKIYTVAYKAGEGTGTVATDANECFLGAAANVSGPTGLIPPAGKVFIGWKAELKVEKSANKEKFTEFGEKITYTYVIRNTGSLAVSGPFTINDDKIGNIDVDEGPENSG